MPVTTWAEVRWALVGCLRLARGDRGGLAFFDRSLDGFWRSFMAAFLGYPLFLTMRISLTEWNAVGGAQIILIETIGYVISWVAFPLVMLSVVRWIGREQRFFDFMVPYNWCQLPQSLLAVLIGLQAEAGLVDDLLSQLIMVAGVVAVFLYEWYIARVSLETSGAAATMIVLLDFVLGELVTRAAGSLY